MSDTAHSTPEAAPGHAHAHHGPSPYKIWGILLALLVVSVVGPMFGIRWLMLITAFGIAFVKATMVARYFMQVNLERRFVPYLLLTMLALMMLMVGAVAPDVMKHDGARWENVAAKAAVERGEKAALEAPAHGEGHGGGHEAAPAH